MSVLDLASVMVRLATKRPLFHSEKDFQHALAWEIQQHDSSHMLRLERRPPHLIERMHVDVWITNGASTIVLELKYKTRRLQTTANGEQFDSLNQSAQDIGRYDFLRDVQRLERIVNGQHTITGYAILLTNDSAYWSAEKGNPTIAADFCLNEGKQLSGPLSWGVGAGAGTMKNREAAIDLTGAYELTWQDYSTVTAASYKQFRFLLMRVK